MHAIYVKIRCVAEFLDLNKEFNLFPSVENKNHPFLIAGAVHICGSENSASFLLYAFGEVLHEKAKYVLSIGVNDCS